MKRKILHSKQKKISKKIFHPKTKNAYRIKKIASKEKEKKVWIKILVGKKILIYQKKTYLPRRRRRPAAPPPVGGQPRRSSPLHNPGRRIRAAAVAGERAVAQRDGSRGGAGGGARSDPGAADLAARGGGGARGGSGRRSIDGARGRRGAFREGEEPAQRGEGKRGLMEEGEEAAAMDLV